MTKDAILNVGLAGFGSIGRTVGDALDKGVPGLRLSVVAVRDQAKAQAHLDTYKDSVPLVSLAELPNVFRYHYRMHVPVRLFVKPLSPLSMPAVLLSLLPLVDCCNMLISLNEPNKPARDSWCRPVACWVSMRCAPPPKEKSHRCVSPHASHPSACTTHPCCKKKASIRKHSANQFKFLPAARATPSTPFPSASTLRSL